jgi:hypothetical protein
MMGLSLFNLKYSLLQFVLYVLITSTVLRLDRSVFDV